MNLPEGERDFSLSRSRLSIVRRLASKRVTEGPLEFVHVALARIRSHPKPPRSRLESLIVKYVAVP